MPKQSPFIAEESATADSLAEWSGQSPLWDPATNRVTFLYHAESDPQAVHLNINRITDKSDFEVGLMRRVSGTRWWIRTLELAPTVCASYGFREYADAAEARPQPPLHNHFGRRLDPGNPHPPLVREGVCGLSLLAGPLAPDQSAWDGAHTAPLPGSLREATLAGRPGWLYEPAQQPVASLWLFDAQTWVERLRLPAVLESLGLPVRIASLCHYDAAQRKQDLAGNDAFLAAFLDEAAAHSGPPGTPRFIAGQSLGALASLNSLAVRPQAADYVLAYSPSMWAGPRGAASPTLDWITHRLCLAEPSPARLKLKVGAREPVLVGRTHLLQLALAGHGWDSELEVIDGGHDIAWWRTSLVADIQRCLRDWAQN